MSVTITLVVFCILAMVIFILALVGALHIMLVKTVSYAITLYFIEKRKYLSGVMQDDVALRITPDTNVH